MNELKLINTVSKVMDTVLKKNPDLKIANGVGYCAYASQLLQEELKKHDIKSELVILRKLRNTPECKEMMKKSDESMMSIPLTDRRYYIKKYLITHPLTLDKIGHAVIVIDGVVFDITSKQFGLPHVYPFKLLQERFISIKRNCKLHMKSIDYFGDVS